MIAFGPIPSRRLGQSLGINHIPPKTCSFDCVYCQVGPTTSKETERRQFYPADEVIRQVRAKVEAVQDSGARIDYLSFVPDGEPTLDIHLGAMMDGLRPLGIPITVFTNSSLLWREDVRMELALADLVSVKVDAADEVRWRQVNRPADGLPYARHVDGLRAFSRGFGGRLISETMLVSGVNDDEESLEQSAALVAELEPMAAYIGVPVRPPSEAWVEIPSEETLIAAHQIFSARIGTVEVLSGFAAESFAVTGDVKRDLLDITAVHPMRESEVVSFLERGGAREADLQRLVDGEELVRVLYRGEPFYIRKISRTEAPAGA